MGTARVLAQRPLNCCGLPWPAAACRRLTQPLLPHPPTLAAADKKGSGADLPQGGTGGSSAHLFAAAYPLLHAGPAGTVGGSLLGNPALLPPRAAANGHRGSTNGSSKEAAAVEDAVANFLGSWGLAFLAGERGSARGVKLAAPQYAAVLTACLVLAANAVPQVRWC